MPKLSETRQKPLSYAIRAVDNKGMHIAAPFPVLRQTTWRLPRNPLAFLVVLSALAVVSVVGKGEIAEIAGAAGVPFALVTTATLSLRSAYRRSGRERWAWMSIGLGFGSASIGVFVVLVREIVIGSGPAFGPTDIFFLLAYVGVMVGAALLPGAFTGQRDFTRTFVDGVVAAVSVGALAWVFSVHEIVEFFSVGSFWDRWVGTAFPLMDVATIVVFAILIGRRTRYRLDRRLALIAAGAIIQAFADLDYLSSGVGQSFENANPKYWLFMLSAALFAGGAYFADMVPAVRDFTESAGHRLAAFVPYGSAIALTVALLVSLPFAGFDANTRVLTGAALTVGVLVVFRQSMAIYDNRVHVDRKRTELVSSISHELRTPLTAVVGFLDLLTDESVALGPEEQADLLNVARNEANQVAGIVSDLVLLTRYAPEDMVLAEESVLVSRLFEDVVRGVDHGDARVSVIVDSELVASLDQGRVRQLLVNLITNAVRYGDGAVQVEATQLGNDLVIRVHDNGKGVPKIARNVIWEMFERGAHRFNAAIPGTGIGLAVVAAIAAAHGGEALYEESDRLGGACFRVVLPGRCAS